MGNGFLTGNNIGDFTFIITTVVIVTEFTKRFIAKIHNKDGKGKSIPTELIVFTYALLLSIAKNVTDAGSSSEGLTDCITCIIFTLINALMISYFATAGYSKAIDNANKYKSKGRNTDVDESNNESEEGN